MPSPFEIELSKTTTGQRVRVRDLLPWQMIVNECYRATHLTPSSYYKDSRKEGAEGEVVGLLPGNKHFFYLVRLPDNEAALFAGEELEALDQLLYA